MDEIRSSQLGSQDMRPTAQCAISSLVLFIYLSPLFLSQALLSFVDALCLALNHLLLNPFVCLSSGHFSTTLQYAALCHREHQEVKIWPVQPFQ